MPVPPDHRRDRVLLILLLLAREAGLAADEVDGPGARALVARGVDRGAVRAYRTAPTPHRRPWTCPRRWTAA